MIRKALLPLAASFLLIGIATLIWRGGAPVDAPKPSGGMTESTGLAPGHRDQPSRQSDDGLAKRSRPARDGSTLDALLQRTLAELATADADDFTGHLKKTTAAWPKENLATAVAALFASADDPAADSLRLALLCRWVSLAPAAASTWAQSLPAGAARESAVNQVALAWCATDAEAAWEWASGLPDDAARGGALLSLAYELSRTDPSLAFARAETFPEGPARSQLLEHAVANWAITDPSAALALVRDIADPALRNSSLGGLAVSWAESDPRSAATLVVDGMEPGPAQERAIASIIQRWAQQDPSGASAWVATFPDGLIKQNSLEHIAEQTLKPMAEP